MNAEQKAITFLAIGLILNTIGDMVVLFAGSGA